MWSAWEAVGFLIKANRAEGSEEREAFSVQDISDGREVREADSEGTTPGCHLVFRGRVSVFESIMWILKVRDMQASAVGDV